MSPVLLLAVVAGAAAGLAVYVVLFKASLALADVTEPGLLKSLVVVLAGTAASGLLSYLVYRLFGLADRPEVALDNATVLWLLVALLISWLVPALLYIPALPVRWFKGVQIAGVEVLLRGLLAALVAGVVLVVLAAAQILARRTVQPPKSALACHAFAALLAPDRDTAAPWAAKACHPAELS
jgi:hypothetical protein